jgi:hypothetical protein
VPRRNLIPFVLLAVLSVGALGFAVLGASSAPSGATLTVQNASVRTFGTPTGSTSFAVDVVNSVTASGSRSASTLVRQVDYKPPDAMTVYQEVGSSLNFQAKLGPAAIACTLSTYTAIVGGSTPWTASGTAFVRTETLATYDARVPVSVGTTCVPRQSTAQGTVKEKAAVRAGYLVGVRVTAFVPPQKLTNGQSTFSGAQTQALVMLEINGTRTAALGS